MAAAKLKGRWTREAVEDVREIWRYYARVASSQIADDYLRKLRQAGLRASDKPLTWRAREDIAPGLRAIRVPPYSLYYRLVSDGVEILRVLHERRDIKVLFKPPTDDS